MKTMDKCYVIKFHSNVLPSLLFSTVTAPYPSTSIIHSPSTSWSTSHEQILCRRQESRIAADVAGAALLGLVGDVAAANILIASATASVAPTADFAASRPPRKEGLLCRLRILGQMQIPFTHYSLLPAQPHLLKLHCGIRSCGAQCRGRKIVS